MRIPYEKLYDTMLGILLSREVAEDDAELLARIIADNSLDGVYTHGTNRFVRMVHNIEDGVVDKDAKATLTSSFGSMECWNGHFGIGPINAWRAMERACELAHANGIGLVALGYNNHWLRGSTYGLLAAGSGCIGICWSNTKPNMPVWGGVKPLVGNNPLIISTPRSDGAHFVFDAAMSQYSYGKLEEYRLKGERLPWPGGFDDEGRLTDDPVVIEANGRVLPIGFWKGSGLSLALDLVATALSDGASVSEVGRLKDERGLTQIMIAIDPARLHDRSTVDGIVDRILGEVSRQGEGIRYPGQRLHRTRQDNLANGVPVIDSIWQSILDLERPSS